MFPTLPDVKIKWVNDVFVNNQKISGSLIETENLIDSNYSKVIMGIGVNINITPNVNEVKEVNVFKKVKEQEYEFTCLKDELSNKDINVDKAKLLSLDKFFLKLSSNVIENYNKTIMNIHESLYSIMKSNLLYFKENVIIIDPTTKEVITEGIFEDFNLDGSVVLLNRKNVKETILYGKMRKGRI